MKTFLNDLQEKKIIIQATCNGKKTCGQCKIRILEDNYPISDVERKFLSDDELNQNIRLACCHEYQPDVQYELLIKELNILEDISISDVSFKGEDGYGIIMDIGTTTIVMKYIELTSGKAIKTISFRNPQATYGGDVISRIKYDSENPGKLHNILITKIEEVLQNNQYQVKRMIVCGNTTMAHLFLGADVSSLGHVPFDVLIKDLVKTSSKQLFANVDDFDVYVFPHISAFVGGDIVSGIMATNIDQSKESYMMIDLGTNGEIVVGNKDKIITTSTAAGPAFEGVGISCGGPSIPGAITSVMIDGDKINYQTIDNQKPQCLCGSGLISLIAQLKRNNLINEMGRFTQDKKSFTVIDNIYITEKDIQIFQLAKAAIQAGVTTLLNENPDVKEIYISGGFGSHLNTDDLIELSIIPMEYRNKIKNVKNSALSGTYLMLANQDYQRLDNIVAKSRHINLAEYPDFDDLLLDGLYF